MQAMRYGLIAILRRELLHWETSHDRTTAESPRGFHGSVATAIAPALPWHARPIPCPAYMRTVTRTRINFQPERVPR
jgi:hypothetical protein